MKDYEKIPFDQIKDIKTYVEKKLKSGHTIIQLLVNEENKEIDELTSYANDKECKSQYRSLTDSDEQLKNCVITGRLEPYYAFKDADKPKDEGYCDIDIGTGCLQVIDFSQFKEEFADMEKYYDGKSFRYSDYDRKMHYEFYISTGKCDIENFGGCMEIDFVTEWMAEMGYYSNKK